MKWNQKTITDFSNSNLNTLYDEGFLFGRIGRGVMDQTRSVRIDLLKFELSSENRRILKKTDGLEITNQAIPYHSYDWSIGKLGKDFYDEKFGEKTFSANKIKEQLTDNKKSNFNKLLIYKFKDETVGYAICRETDELLHYCYPFYILNSKFQIPNSIGLGMMLRAILWAGETNKQYVYLGSAQRPSDTYKLQFEGIEWFDGKEWQTDLLELKKLL
ncbi:MAG: hypothetical protein AAB467_02235 [Patescibacteria group bacterium]